MSVINQTEEQNRKEIIEILNQNVFVEAGAGAGKTTLIVNRIINQLKSGVLPQEIVVITFTNAAAEELNKISHRVYSTGFYFGVPENSQTYENAGYVRDYAVAAIVVGYEDGCVLCEMKNKFALGTEFDCLEPRSIPFSFKVESMFNEKGESIDVAPHPTMIVKIPFEREIKAGALLRMKS